jgi:hypothetical protein
MRPHLTTRPTLACAGVAVGLVFASAAPAAALTIKQNSTDTITAGLGFSCNSGSEHTDNTYLRRFDLDGAYGVDQAFNVSSVSFGVELANSGLDPSQPASVRVYSIAASDPTMTFADLTLLADVPTTVLNSDTGTIRTVPVSATIANPTTTDLVVALFTPNGQAADHQFFLGANADAETGPSYIAASDCGAPEPTTVASLGFPDTHFVLFADGNVVDTDADDDGVPDASDVCPGTVLPDNIRDLQRNRYAADAQGVFRDRRGTSSGYTVTDTGGCSARQIVAAAGLGKGQLKYGLSRSALEAWIAGLSVEQSSAPTVSGPLTDGSGNRARWSDAE